MFFLRSAAWRKRPRSTRICVQRSIAMMASVVSSRPREVRTVRAHHAEALARVVERRRRKVALVDLDLHLSRTHERLSRLQHAVLDAELVCRLLKQLNRLLVLAVPRREPATRRRSLLLCAIQQLLRTCAAHRVSRTGGPSDSATCYMPITWLPRARGAPP